MSGYSLSDFVAKTSEKSAEIHAFEEVYFQNKA